MLKVFGLCGAILATALFFKINTCTSIPDGTIDTNVKEALKILVNTLLEEKMRDMKQQYETDKLILLKKVDKLEREQKGLIDLINKLMESNENLKNTLLTVHTSDTESVANMTSLPALLPSPGKRVRRAVGQVAFSAYLSVTRSNMQIGQAIKFDKVLTNDGNGYNPYTGAFTAPLSGTYLFSFHFDTRVLTFTRLVVNGVNQVDAVANRHTGPLVRGSHTMGGNTAVVHVGQGEAVLVETYELPDSETASNETFRLCTFSGVLMY